MSPSAEPAVHAYPTPTPTPAALELLGRPDLRAHPRFELATLLPATIGRTEARIEDLSRGGARLRHVAALASSDLRLRFKWGARQFDSAVTVISSQLQRVGLTAQALYETRVSFASLSGDAERTLGHVVSTLHDQQLQDYLANFRGDVNRVGSSTKATQPPTSFFLCTSNNGRWQRRLTRTPDSCPANGFIVPASAPEGDIRKMTRLFGILDDDGRELLRLFALQVQ